MNVKPNTVLLIAIKTNEHSAEKLFNQRKMVTAAIKAWSPGGGCYKEKSHIKGYCEEQKGYFTEALALIDRYLNKHKRQAA